MALIHWSRTRQGRRQTAGAGRFRLRGHLDGTRPPACSIERDGGGRRESRPVPRHARTAAAVRLHGSSPCGGEISACPLHAATAANGGGLIDAGGARPPLPACAAAPPLRQAGLPHGSRRRRTTVPLPFPPIRPAVWLVSLPRPPCVCWRVSAPTSMGKGRLRAPLLWLTLVLRPSASPAYPPRPGEAGRRRTTSTGSSTPPPARRTSTTARWPILWRGCWAAPPPPSSRLAPAARARPTLSWGGWLAPPVAGWKRRQRGIRSRRGPPRGWPYGLRRTCSRLCRPRGRGGRYGLLLWSCTWEHRRTFSLEASQRRAARAAAAGGGDRGTGGARGAPAGAYSQAGHQAEGVRLLPSAGGGTKLSGATAVTLATLPEFCTLLDAALGRRRTSATKLNSSSSRSHAVVELAVVGPPSSVDAPAPPTTSFWLFDLVGGEGLGDSEACGVQEAETKANNRDLHALGLVFAALRRPGYVPFRNSSVTSLLQAALLRGGRAVMVACVSLAAPLSALKSTLRRAEDARGARARPGVRSVTEKAGGAGVPKGNAAARSLAEAAAPAPLPSTAAPSP